MKKYIFLSNEYHAGKTSIILGLGLLLKEKQRSLAYFKPWSILSQYDEKGDLIDSNLPLIKNALELPEDETNLFGLSIPPNYLSEFLNQGKENILQLIHAGLDYLLEKPYDFLFIEGHGYPFFGQFLDISHKTISDYVKAQPIIIGGIEKIDIDRIVDSILAIKAMYNTDQKFLCILNKVPLDYPKEQISLIIDELAKFNIDVIGTIPESKILANPTVQDIFKRLQGQAIIPPTEENASLLVHEFMIGAMDVDAALPYFRKYSSKAVITGGDRSDLILASMETDTNLIIVTGTKYPESKVLLQARKRKIPMLLVPYDTHTVTKQINNITWLTPPNNKNKIEEIKNLVNTHVNLDKIGT